MRSPFPGKGIYLSKAIAIIFRIFPARSLITNGEKDYQVYMGKMSILEWDLGDSITQSIATGFINLKKLEGYTSKEIV